MSNAPNVDELIEQLHAHNLDRPDDQFKAAIALGQVTDEAAKPRIVDALIKALSPAHQALTRAHAAQSLGQLGDPRALYPLLDALKDGYQLVRAYAASSIPSSIDPAAIPPLLETLKNDPFYGARAAAAGALGHLVRHCPQDDPRVREAVAILQIMRDEERKKKENSNDRVLRELYAAVTSEEAVAAAEKLEQTLLETRDALEDSERDKQILREQLDRARRRVQELELRR